MTRALSLSLALLACGCERSTIIAVSDAALDAGEERGDIDAARSGIAFHGVEGYGRTVMGGRTGEVYTVTTLATSGPGSLNDAVSADGRIVVFAVGGYIDGGVTIRGSHITIAGQSAPGGGVTIRGGGLACADGVSDVVIRFLHVRPGYQAGSTQDAIFCRFVEGLVVDHVSASWATGVNLAVYGGSNSSVQWSIASEALAVSGASEGGTLGGDRVSIHHNLLAGNGRGNPVLSGSTVDVRDNVIYNWGSTYAASGGVDGLNLIANTFKPGPSTPAAGARVMLWPSGIIRAYVAGNVMTTASDITASNDLGISAAFTKVANELPMQWIYTDSTTDALTYVLKYAGDCLHRDAVDTRILAAVANGAGTIIQRESDVGGWPSLAPGTAPIDSDRDGMPDDYETAQGLNPADPSDGSQDADNDTYTNVEEYLQGLTSVCFPRWL